MTTAFIESQPSTDPELVEQCISGDRDAFARIVRKYQNLICAVTYSACGDFHAAQDVAQTTFITAWRHMRYLADPAKLRAWLCGIARYQSANYLRAQRRMHAARATDDLSDPKQSPETQAISKEEQSLLWKSVSTLPASLREPLILFYQQDQSVREVAQALEISEEAVRQRLTRGRMMLRDSLATFVEVALHKGKPTKAFTLSVLAALPLTAASAKAAIVGTAATKTAKIAGFGSISHALTIILPPALLGALTGWRMKRDAAASPQGRQAVNSFWRLTLIAVAICAATPLLLVLTLFSFFRDREHMLSLMTWWLGITYLATFTGLAIWLFRRRRSARTSQSPAPIAAAPRCIKYPLLAVLIAGFLLYALFFLIDPGRSRLVTSQEAQHVLTTDPTARLWIHQYASGQQTLLIGWPPKHNFLVTPVDPPLSQFLQETHPDIPVLIEGKDFGIFGWPGRLLPWLLLFIIAAGVTVLLTRTTFRRRTPAAAQTPTTPSKPDSPTSPLPQNCAPEQGIRFSFESALPPKPRLRFSKRLKLILVLPPSTMILIIALLYLCRKVDNIDLPFVDDPQVLGHWTAVDFVSTPDQFKSAARQSNVELYLKDLTFLPHGQSPRNEMWSWTKGHVLYTDTTDCQYQIRTINGADYLFFQWKSGDYTYFRRTPWWYVLRREPPPRGGASHAKTGGISFGS